MAHPEPTVAAADGPSVKTPNNVTITAQRPVCALYMRVSTKNHGQTCDTQAGPLRQYAERRGFDVIEYKDDTPVGGEFQIRPVSRCFYLDPITSITKI
jgi:hypothetical protein